MLEEPPIHALNAQETARRLTDTHGEQGRKLKLSFQRHLQLSGRRQVQPALDRQTAAVAAVLPGEEERRR